MQEQQEKQEQIAEQQDYTVQDIALFERLMYIRGKPMTWEELPDIIKVQFWNAATTILNVTNEA